MLHTYCFLLLFLYLILRIPRILQSLSSIVITAFFTAKSRTTFNMSIFYSIRAFALWAMIYHKLFCAKLINNIITYLLMPGFEKIGQFKEVGLKFGKWVDVGYWEFIF